MKTTFLLLFLVAATNKSLSEDAIAFKKSLFLIQIGAYYKTFPGDKYIEPTDPFMTQSFESHKYDRFEKVPTFGYNAGIIYFKQLKGQCSLGFGLIYFLRKDLFKKNEDTLIKYVNITSTRDIHDVLKFNYSYNNFELPIMLRYSKNKCSFYIGSYFSIISYRKATYTYLVNQSPIPFQWASSNKTVFDWEITFKVFPTIQVSYKTKIGDINFCPYLASYYAVYNQNDVYLQIGLNFPITKKQKYI